MWDSFSTNAASRAESSRSLATTVALWALTVVSLYAINQKDSQQKNLTNLHLLSFGYLEDEFKTLMLQKLRCRRPHRGLPYT
jgi:hypothetical protein